MKPNFYTIDPQTGLAQVGIAISTEIRSGGLFVREGQEPLMRDGRVIRGILVETGSCGRDNKRYVYAVAAHANPEGDAPAAILSVDGDTDVFALHRQADFIDLAHASRQSGFCEHNLQPAVVAHGAALKLGRWTFFVNANEEIVRVDNAELRERCAELAKSALASLPARRVLQVSPRAHAI